MPRLVRLYIVSIAWGALLGAVFTGLLIALDVAGLRHLVWATRGGVIAVAMLLAFHILLFSGVQFGIAVMRMGPRPGFGAAWAAQALGRAAADHDPGAEKHLIAGQRPWPFSGSVPSQGFTIQLWTRCNNAALGRARIACLKFAQNLSGTKLLRFLNVP